MSDLESDLRATLRALVDATPVTRAPQLPEMSQRRKPNRLARRVVGICALGVMSAAVVGGILWQRSSSSLDQPKLVAGEQATTAQEKALPVASAPISAGGTSTAGSTGLAAPDESDLVLGAAVLLSDTPTTLVFVPKAGITTGSLAELQEWDGHEWKAKLYIALSWTGGSQQRQTRDTPVTALAIQVPSNTLLFADLPGLSAGTYRLSLGQGVASILRVCSGCNPALGAPMSDHDPLRVSPALVAAESQNVTVELSSADANGSTRPPFSIDEIQRWTGKAWAYEASNPSQSVGPGLGKLINSLRPGAYRIVASEPESSPTELAGFFVH